MFLADPTAPISAVAERAGVGIGALYHRYAGKEDLLRTLCRNGQEIYLAEIKRALASDAEPWEAFTGFLRRIVAANTTASPPGSPAPSRPPRSNWPWPNRCGCWVTSYSSGPRLPACSGTTSRYLDIGYLLEFLADVKLGGAGRTAELRQRHLAVIIDGLRSGQHTPLPGKPPTWEEQTERWITQ